MADYLYSERSRADDRRRYDERDRDRRLFSRWDERGDRRDWDSDDRWRRDERMRSQGRYSDDQRFGNRDSQREVPINETRALIASNKVEGTPVYSRRGDRLGSIYNLMINKRSGEVKYAVMTTGGFLGMGADYKPVPWQMLTYDEREDGYVVDMSQDDLHRAPSFRRGEEPTFDREYDMYVHRWYGTY